MTSHTSRISPHAEPRYTAFDNPAGLADSRTRSSRLPVPCPSLQVNSHIIVTHRNNAPHYHTGIAEATEARYPTFINRQRNPGNATSIAAKTSTERRSGHPNPNAPPLHHRPRHLCPNLRESAQVLHSSIAHRGSA